MPITLQSIVRNYQTPLNVKTNEYDMEKYGADQFNTGFDYFFNCITFTLYEKAYKRFWAPKEQFTTKSNELTYVNDDTENEINKTQTQLRSCGQTLATCTEQIRIDHYDKNEKKSRTLVLEQIKDDRNKPIGLKMYFDDAPSNYYIDSELDFDKLYIKLQNRSLDREPDGYEDASINANSFEVEYVGMGGDGDWQRR